MAEQYDVVIIGAGITGASAAHFLKKKGVERVLLLDRGGAAAGNTARSAAIVRSFYTIPVMARLAREAVRLFHGLREEIGSDGGFEATGFTQLVPPDWVGIAEEKVAMHQGLGIDTRFVPQDEWAQRFPWLNLEGVGAIILETESGYADPVRTVEGFVDSFVRAGGEFRPRTPARALLREGDRITGVLLDDGEVGAGIVVNAAGPWSSMLAKSADLDLPLRAVREQDAVWEGCAATGRFPTRRYPIPSRRSTCAPWGRAGGCSDGAIPSPTSTSTPTTSRKPATTTSWSTSTSAGASGSRRSKARGCSTATPPSTT